MFAFFFTAEYIYMSTATLIIFYSESGFTLCSCHSYRLASGGSKLPSVNFFGLEASFFKPLQCFVSGVLITIFTLTQPQRVDPVQRIRCVLIQVQPACDPYRILAYKSAYIRIIVSETVIVKTRFRIVVLNLVKC